MNNPWLDGLMVAVIGMLVVFAGLIILIAAISLMRAFKQKEQQPVAPVEKAPVAVPVPVPAAPVPQASAPKEEEITAAIMAALSVILKDSTNGFVVKRIRRLPRR